MTGYNPADVTTEEEGEIRRALYEVSDTVLVVIDTKSRGKESR